MSRIFTMRLLPDITARSLLVTAVIALTLLSAHAADNKAGIDDRVNEIAHLLMCPVCRGQTVAESNSNLAYDMRQIIRKQLEEGKSEKEVLEYFTSRYGESILAAPPAKGVNWLLWLLPAALIAGGLGAALVYLSGIRKNKGPGAGDKTDIRGEDSEYLRKIDEEIEKRGI